MRILLILITALLLNGCASEPKARIKQNSFLLTNVNVVDVKNRRILAKQNILVKDGLIKTISSQQPTSNDLPVIDGQQGYITPGLIDMHVHTYEPAAYKMTLSHGVTHIRIMNGVAEHLDWRDQVNKGEMTGSSSTVSSPIISGYMDAILQHGVNTPDSARAAVRLYQQQGYDLIKAYGNLDPNSLAALFDEAKKLNMPIAKHGPHGAGDVSVDQLNHAQSFEHVEDIFQGSLKHQFALKALPKVIADLKKTAVPITPTLNVFAQLTNLSKDKEAHIVASSAEYTPWLVTYHEKNNQVKRWIEASDNMVAHNQRTLRFLITITQKLNEANIPLLVGSDSGVLLSPHGLSTHDEMALLSKAGLSNFEVLQAATINAANALGMTHELGQIASGFQADFIYTRTDPTVNLGVLKHSEAVIKNGQWYSRATLDNMRNQAINSRSFIQEAILLFNAL